MYVYITLLCCGTYFDFIKEPRRNCARGGFILLHYETHLPSQPSYCTSWVFTLSLCYNCAIMMVYQGMDRTFVFVKLG
jgi:hypothetical protein